jgi:hypothetical protein
MFKINRRGLEITLILIYLLSAIGLTPGGSSTVQYTFSHKQYTEQPNETEYTERNIRNNKNT